MEILKEIDRLAGKTLNQRLKKAKESGRKIIGYFCTHVPEEVIHAAGFIPYRMRAVESSGTTESDTFFSSRNCSYIKHCFNKALNGEFDFLDGVVFMNGCDHSRRLYDNWRYAGIKPDYLELLIVPHILADPAPKQYLRELIRLKTSIENRFKIEITDTALEKAIILYNRKRELLKIISESRKKRAVPIKGSEFSRIMLAVTALPVEEAIPLLEEIENGLEKRTVSSENVLRVVISGNCIEDTKHFELIEDCGSAIVADKICLGSPYFDTNVEEQTGQPLKAVADRYLSHLSCPRMVDNFRQRLASMEEKIKTFHGDALILDKLEFCTLFTGESVLYQQEAKKINVPTLLYDRELYGGSTGQIKTRVQAFFEKVRNLKEDQ